MGLRDPHAHTAGEAPADCGLEVMPEIRVVAWVRWRTRNLDLVPPVGISLGRNGYRTAIPAGGRYCGGLLKESISPANNIVTKGSTVLLAVAITTDTDLLAATADVLADISDATGGSFSAEPHSASAPIPQLTSVGSRVHETARDLAAGYLRRTLAGVPVRLLTAATADEAVLLLADQATRGQADLALIVGTLPVGSDPAAWACELKGVLRAAEACHPGDRAFPSAILYVQSPSLCGPVRMMARHDVRIMPTDPWLLRTELLMRITDFVQGGLLNPLNRGRAGVTRLSGALVEAMHRLGQPNWSFSYYTGSVVSSLIEDVESRAEAEGAVVIRGTNESALASGALARWHLMQSPFLIVVTSAMIDEFKGTLANLRDSGARGFIVCAEADPGQWFPFQGTMHEHENIGRVLAARGLGHVFMTEPTRMEDDLRAASDLLLRSDGPVVLLATQRVLEEMAASSRVDEIGLESPRAAQTGHLAPTLTESALDRVMHLINTDSATVLWQCGYLSDRERELVVKIAESAGIALADSLTRPGTISGFVGGSRVSTYVGSLGIYGFSDTAHRLLHRKGRLGMRGSQVVFFLKSRAAQAMTPLSEGGLSHKLVVAQLTERADHIAPFTDIPLVCRLSDFLEAVWSRLDVDPEVVAARRAAIEEARRPAPLLSEQVPTSPMSSNYFFASLSSVLEDLIASEGFRYVGVFDVGRAAAAAVRHLPRTGTGFSGWYGRAAMGDAYQAIPAITASTDMPVLAFVGDGSRAIGPDITEVLAEQAMHGKLRCRNLSIFTLNNGGHSIIGSYQQVRQLRPLGRQMGVPNVQSPPGDREVGPLRIRDRTLWTFDRNGLAEGLRAVDVVNEYTINLEHNSTGDGMSLMSTLGWQNHELPDLAYRVTRPGEKP